MKTKRLSLPRIKEQEIGKPAISKILKEFHRVKWSISPQCLVKGHEGKQIQYVCLHKNFCEVCFFKDHEKHNLQFMAIDEVKAGKIDNLRFWPFEEKYRRLFDFICKHDGYVSNLVQDVNAIFNGMAVRVLSSIDKIRLSLLTKIDNFYLKETAKTDLCSKIKEELPKCFELQKIQEAVRQLFSKEIRHEVFLQRMKTVLNNRETERSRQLLMNYYEGADKGKDMLLDRVKFNNLQNWIVHNIEEQQSSLIEQAVAQQSGKGIEHILVQSMLYLQGKAANLQGVSFVKEKMEDGEYVGFMSAGERCIFGTKRYGNGTVYTGQWRINSKNGWGIYQNKSQGYKYTGGWKEDRRSGYGREEQGSSLYEGNFAANKRDGFGILTQNGIRTEISWKNGKMNGSGRRIDRNGLETEIYFLNGMESILKAVKTSPAFDLKQLSRRFTKSSQTTSSMLLT